MTLAEEIRAFLALEFSEVDTACDLLERAADALEAADEEAAADEAFRRTAYLLSTPPRGNW